MAADKTIVFHPDFKARQQILDIIADFKAEGEVLKDKRNVLKRVGVVGQRYIIKSFKKPHLINQVVYGYLRPTKARRSFEFANLLLERGINTPKPVAYIEESAGLGLGHSYYISEEVDYELTYRELIHEPNYPNREQILREFTQFTFKLHENDILFLDHSPGNTLIVNRQGFYDFYLVDLNRMKITPLDFEARMRNFVRLYPTPDMIEIMSDEYAKLYSRDYPVVFGAMSAAFHNFKRRYERKKGITRPLKKLFKKG